MAAALFLQGQLLDLGPSGSAVTSKGSSFTKSQAFRSSGQLILCTIGERKMEGRKGDRAGGREEASKENLKILFYDFNHIAYWHI